MGSWGPELDANDDAQDALEEFSAEIAAAKKNPSLLAKLFQKVSHRYRANSDAVLGVGWVLEKRHISLKPVKALLLKHLERELSEKQLRRWSGQEERRQSLLSFQYKLEGKPFPRTKRAPIPNIPLRKPVQIGSKWGYRDAKGKLVIKPQFDFADDFEQGVARIRIGFKPKPVRYGLIDMGGRFLIKPRYEEMDVFFHGVAMIHCKGKVGYVNREGKEIVAPVWDEGRPFEEGVAPVRKGKRWGLFEPNGRLLLQPEWDAIYEWSPSSVLGKKNGRDIEIKLTA
jgi:hypothetical protein